VPPDILLSKHGRPGRFHPNPERRPTVNVVPASLVAPRAARSSPKPLVVSPGGVGDRRICAHCTPLPTLAQPALRSGKDHYNDIRLNSAIGYVTPKDMLAGHQQEIQADRDRKFEAVREQRKSRRQRAT
jgi:hypothetical protein